MRETWLRLTVKSIEWRLSGILLSAILGQATFHDWRLGAIFGGIYNIIRLILMPIRDKLWSKIRLGTTNDDTSRNANSTPVEQPMR